MNHGNPALLIPNLSLCIRLSRGWRWVTAMRREIREASPRGKKKKKIYSIIVQGNYLVSVSNYLSDSNANPHLQPSAPNLSTSLS